MSDGFKLAEILNPDVIRAYLNQMQLTSPAVAEQAAPPAVPADVPVRYVPAPVTLEGSMRFKATFTHDQLEGKNYEALVAMVGDVFQDPQARNPWLPEVSINNINLWEERVDVGTVTAVPAAAISGGIPQTRPRDSVEHAVDSGTGIPDTSATSVQPIRPSMLCDSVTSGGGTEVQSRAAREAGNGIGGGQESGTGGPGWQPTFPSSKEEDTEES
jgi:hypothetical protein